MLSDIIQLYNTILKDPESYLGAIEPYRTSKHCREYSMIPLLPTFEIAFQASFLIPGTGLGFHKAAS